MSRARSTGVAVLAAMTAAVLCTPTPARAQYDAICNLLGEASPFRVVATKKLKTKHHKRNPEGLLPYPVFGSAVCAPKIRAGKVGFWWSDLVATEDRSAAIRFKVVRSENEFRCNLCSYGYCDCPSGYYCGGYYPCNAHRLYYADIITGGGAVKARKDLMPYLPYGNVIDTSGANPRVEECQTAIDHLQPLSDALAVGLLPGEPPHMARPIIDLGNLLRVEADEVAVLEPTPGQDYTFYQVKDVEIAQGPLYCYYGYCYQYPGGLLEIQSGEDNGIILNVTGRFKLNRAATVEDFGGSGVVNVVGKGRQVIFKKQSTFEPTFLAPQRKVTMRGHGGEQEYYYATAGRMLARIVHAEGSAFVGNYGYSPDECSPY